MKIKHILVVAMTLLLLSGCGNGGSDSADSYTPPALDENATYYADIEIADYGMITIQLDQSVAPVTCANFVELAENGLFFHLKQSMIKNKIDKMVIHATATKPSQVELINDYVKSLTEKDIIGFVMC